MHNFYTRRSDENSDVNLVNKTQSEKINHTTIIDRKSETTKNEFASEHISPFHSRKISLTEFPKDKSKIVNEKSHLQSEFSDKAGKSSFVESIVS